jgi:type 2 lantibiotic biosynthesis protein LanM
MSVFLDNSSPTEPISFNPDAPFYNALSLKERVALLRQTHSSKEITTSATSDSAKRKLQRWKGQKPFNKPNYFEERLAVAGLSEDELYRLLTENEETIKGQLNAVPDWLENLKEAFTQTDQPQQIAIAQAPEEEYNNAAYLEIVKLLLTPGLKRLVAKAQHLTETYPEVPFDPTSVAELFLPHLLPKLGMILTPTLVLEVNVARVQGELQGANSQERFHYFVQQLSQPQRLIAFLKEYPVLARQLMQVLDNWVNYSCEFLQHLCSDWPQLVDTFHPEAPTGNLIEIKSGGDTHRKGRSTFILRFSSGFRLLYKPRSHATDRHFQELLDWLNQQSTLTNAALPPFRILKVLDRGTYGWTEFVEARGCSSPEQVGRFYERLGAYLAVMYALQGTDFHYENLIAAGEDPMLIDLEALFHPHLEANNVEQLRDPAVILANYSVLRVGLLPGRQGGNEQSEGLDLSGLGSHKKQLTPRPIPVLTDWGTDQIRVEYRQLEIEDSNQHRPLLQGQEVSVEDYLDHLLNGFTNAYHLLLAHREALIAGPLQKFANDHIRVICRATQIYGRLLQESFHPDWLRHALERERLLDRLWAVVEFRPVVARIIEAEREALQQGDIPLFTTTPASRDLLTEQSDVIPAFFEESSLSWVKQHILRLSEADLKRQSWFIQASFASVASNKLAEAAQANIAERTTAGSLVEEVTPAQLKEAALAVGRRLNELALESDGYANWVGLELTRNHQWKLNPAGLSLYDGTPGIALFLAYLGQYTNQETYTELARAALKTVELQLSQVRNLPTPPGIGAFQGLGSAMYLFTHLGVLWNEGSLLKQAEELARSSASLIGRDQAFDVTAGVAGYIITLLNLYQFQPSPVLLELALQGGEHLVANAQPQPVGIAWPARKSGQFPYAGLSHGTAGIALSLLKLAEYCSDAFQAARFKHTALAALEYERSIFSPDAQNWPLISHKSASYATGEEYQIDFMTSWCHGAPGIGMARLAGLNYLDNAQVRQEIEIALATTLRKGFGHNHSLCHGDMGNLELLLMASEAEISPGYRQELARQSEETLAVVQQNGWISGVPREVEVPGLMVGLAGFGYGLLRLAFPDKIPSVLTLAPPQRIAKL